MLLIHSYLLKEVPLECCSTWYFWYQLGIFEAKKGQKYQMVFLPRLNFDVAVKSSVRQNTEILLRVRE